MNTLLVSLLRQPRDNGRLAQPFGISQVAACLSDDGHEVSGLDIPYFAFKYSDSKTIEKLRQVISSTKPKVVGVSLYDLSEKTNSYLKKIKELSKSLLVAGRQIATLFPYETLDSVDMAIIGEGEVTSRKAWGILDKCDSNLDSCLSELLEVSGVALKIDGEKTFNGAWSKGLKLKCIIQQHR